MGTYANLHFIPNDDRLGTDIEPDGLGSCRLFLTLRNDTFILTDTPANLLAHTRAMFDAVVALTDTMGEECVICGRRGLSQGDFAAVTRAPCRDCLGFGDFDQGNSFDACLTCQGTGTVTMPPVHLGCRIDGAHTAELDRDIANGEAW